MTTLTRSSRLQRNADTVWREIDGKSVVISLDSGRIRTLNGTAATLWKALDGRSLDELATMLAELHPDEPRATVDDDVARFVSDLVARGMAKVVDGA